MQVIVWMHCINRNLCILYYQQDSCKRYSFSSRQRIGLFVHPYQRSIRKRKFCARQPGRVGSLIFPTKKQVRRFALVRGKLPREKKESSPCIRNCIARRLKSELVCTLLYVSKQCQWFVFRSQMCSISL